MLLSWLVVYLAAVAFHLTAAAASAQTVFDQNGFGTGRGTYSALPYEHVDPLTGNLIVVTTDLVLPGNAGMDIVVQRVYNSAVYPNYENGGDKTLREDSWAGIGWRLHFGRVLFESDNGSGKTRIEMGDGSEHPLYATTAHAGGWITKDLWVYDKNSHTLKLPNGRVYTFGRQVFIANLGIVRYVTEIRDPFNNTLEFAYFAAGGPPDGVAQIRQDLGVSPGLGSQVRLVSFGYDPVRNSLASMTYEGHTWTYGQTAFGPVGYSRLDSVQPPALAKPWLYTYENYGQTGFVGLTKMQAPSGGEVTYVYGDSTRTAGPGPTYYTQLSRVVTTRSIGGPPETAIQAGTWTFSYNAGPNKDQTIVDCPCGKTAYRYLAIGTDATQSFESWTSGLLAERKVLSPSDQVLEREVLTWQRSEPVSPDAIPATAGIWGDSAVHKALLTRRVLERGSTSWITDYQYRTHQGTYNDFGQPFQITETGGGQTRTTTRTFWYGAPLLHIAGLIGATTVTVGSETLASSAAYNSTTAAMTSQTVNGLVSSFGHHANGNLRTVTDPHSHVTTIPKYSWGVSVETQTPLLTTYRIVSDAGLVTREEVGALQTNYTYDLALRPKTVVPPNANPIVYSYDNMWDGWSRVSRGSGETHTTVDGFGRAISSSDQVGQKTRLQRDACGRVVFEALSYRNPIFATRGFETTYDALGRVTKKKFVGGGTVTAETVYAYDGLHVTITDALGRVTRQEYTAIGGPGDAVLAAVVDAANQRTTYAYDIGKRLRQVGGAMPSRTWSYNAQGLLQQETQPESGSTSYTYDGGLLKTITDALGQVFTFSYDANDRLVTQDGPGTASDMTQTYDAIGRLSTQQNAATTTTFQYDNAGRLSLRRDLFETRTYESLYGYDGNDNLTSLTYPSGRVVGYTYDAEDRLTGVSQNGNPFAGSFLYDDSGALASYVTGAVTHRTEFDILQRVSRTAAGPGALPFDLTYAYNAGNQVTSITDARYGESTYQYDLLNRMKQAHGPWGTYSWTYDAAGNRLTEQMGGPTAFTYDTAKQRLTSFLTQTGGELFTYDTVGRLAADSRGSYNYTPGGLLASVTRPNLAANYTYDATSARILRTVNGIGHYTLRGADGQMLSEYEARCGAPVWTRDVVYAGSRAIGSIKAPSDLPTIALTTTSSTVTEAAGTVSVTVRLTTPTGMPTACAASVSYGVITHAGEAARGADFSGAVATLAFPAGTASGATQAIAVAVKQDGIYETSERFTIVLDGATGAQLGAADHIVTITNDDPAPSITINDPVVTEGPGAQALFTLTLSPASIVQAEVNYTTAPESARANVDYLTTAGRVIFVPGETQKQVAVAIVDDAHTEPPETFLLQLSSPLHATLARTFGRATVTDNEGPRRPIDPSLPGTYLPDLTTSADTAAYVPIFNPHSVSVTARLTFTRPNGSGTIRDVVVPAQKRVTIDLASEPVIGGQGDVSLVVQSLDVTRPLVAEASIYWQTDWRGGRSARGSTALAPITYFGEGATGAFEEFLIVYNPSNEPVNALVKLYAAGGGLQQFTVPILSGPGRVKIRVNDYAPSLEHGSSVSGLTLAGTPVSLAVERTMYWLGGDRRDGHSTNGLDGAGETYYFAEGTGAPFSTFLAFANPNTTASNVLVHYLHENGTDYQQTASIPPYGRITLSPPGTVPAGSFAIHTEATNAVGYAVERVVYGGADWTLGDAETGAPAAYTNWKFAEGAASSFFSSFLLFGNPSTTAATVALTFRLEGGGTVTSSVTVPARGRATVGLNGIPGLSGTFAIEVAVTNGVPIVAERAMYWPASSWDGAHTSRGRSW